MRAPRPRRSLVAGGGLLRYLSADLARSQSWVAPCLAYLVVVVISNNNRASLLSTYAGTATFLFFAATWLAFVALGNEDPAQVAITVATVGSDRVVYAAKLLLGWVASLILALLATIWPLLVRSYTPPLDAAAVLEGLVFHAVTALFGVAVAAVSQRLVRRLGWVVLLCCGIGLAEVTVPDLPPVRQMLSLLDADHPHAISSGVAAISAETLALFGLMSAAAFLLPRPFR